MPCAPASAALSCNNSSSSCSHVVITQATAAGTTDGALQNITELSWQGNISFQWGRNAKTKGILNGFLNPVARAGSAKLSQKGLSTQLCICGTPEQHLPIVSQNTVLQHQKGVFFHTQHASVCSASPPSGTVVTNITIPCCKCCAVRTTFFCTSSVHKASSCGLCQ